jgi:hypothetical protein
MRTDASKATRRKPGGRGARPVVNSSGAAEMSDSPRYSADDSAQQPDSSGCAALLEPEQRHAMIAGARYFRAKQRGFEPRQELADWCAAESEVDDLLLRGQPIACNN